MSVVSTSAMLLSIPCALLFFQTLNCMLSGSHFLLVENFFVGGEHGSTRSFSVATTLVVHYLTEACNSVFAIFQTFGFSRSHASPHIVFAVVLSVFLC